MGVRFSGSRSGYSALTEWMFLNDIQISAVQVSGSHSSSLTLLEQGLADLAAIDVHTVNQLGLQLALPVIGISTEALAPPYVYHRNSGLSSDLLMQALASAVQKKGSDIGITGIVKSDRTYYEDSFATTEIQSPAESKHLFNRLNC